MKYQTVGENVTVFIQAIYHSKALADDKVMMREYD